MTTLVRAGGVVLGLLTVLACGWIAGGGWWAVAGVAAAATVGGLFDRQLAFVQVLVSLALVAAVVDAGQGWAVVVIAAGTIGSLELATAGDRTSVVRCGVPDLRRIARVVPAAAVLSLAILVVGNVSNGGPVLAPAGAALAAVVAIRVLAR